MSISPISSVNSAHVSPTQLDSSRNLIESTTLTPGISGQGKDNSILTSNVGVDDKSQVLQSSNTPPARISTSDFLQLRTNSSDQQFEVLDTVIQRMKENIEELGDFIETMAKLAKKTSKQTIALKLLQATFDAIEKIEAGPGARIDER